MENAQLNDKVIAKLKKMLALATDKRGNEHEAAAAMEMVQSTLAAYNLSIADIEAAGESNAADHKRAKDTLEKSALYQYQRDLMSAIAECHYCIYWTGIRNKYARGGRITKQFYHVLIGREANVIGAKLMFDYLNGTIERLANEIYPNPLNLSRTALSWKLGASERLQERLQQRRRDADEAQAAKARAATAAAQAAGDGSGTALALLSDVRQTEDDLNCDFRFGRAPGTTAMERAKGAAQYAANQAAREARRVADEAAENVRLAKLTPEQRAREEAKAAAEEAKAEAANQRYWEAYLKREMRAASRIDQGARRAGKAKGGDIGLDTQIDKRTQAQIG